MNFTSSLFISIAIALAGISLGEGLKAFNRGERTISVRGLAEREVKADLGTWTIRYVASGDRLEEVQQRLPVLQKHVTDFLAREGFTAEEISKGSSLVDKEAREYGDQKGKRFVANAFVALRTSKVDQLQAAEQKLDELLKLGLVITNTDKDFHFTQLNNVKPPMLEEATQNAREAAAGFAKSMKVDVGSLRSASQGVFSIDNQDGDRSGSSLMKKVRVVTQVEFEIE